MLHQGDLLITHFLMQKNVYEFISHQTNDPIVEWKICKVSGEEFPIYKRERELLDQISPIIG